MSERRDLDHEFMLKTLQEKLEDVNRTIKAETYWTSEHGHKLKLALDEQDNLAESIEDLKAVIAAKQKEENDSE